MQYFLAILAVASWLPPTKEVTSTSGMRLSASRCFCPNAPCPATQIFIAFLQSNRRHCERNEAIQRIATLDCFVAEPVIGPATSGGTRWLLAMTISCDDARPSLALPRV